MRISIILLRLLPVLWLGGLWACQNVITGGEEEDDTPPPPAWYFDLVAHDAGTEAVFHDIWGRSDGVLFAVGQDGLILTNADDEGLASETFSHMTSPTTVHLRAITGIENGDLFGLPRPQGEMFAVGWYGTLLHYHPNPDANADTLDGAWSVVATAAADDESGALSFLALQKVDPFCPDYDGDGIADDGDGSGWAGDAICADGETTSCDDNCRTSANGTMRPLTDYTLPPDGCIDGSDGPRTEGIQEDADGDGAGAACDREDSVFDARTAFDAPLFDIYAERVGDDLRIAAVGGDGAIVIYEGPSAATAVTAPQLPVTTADAWRAQRELPYRFDDDCDGSTAAGLSCPSSGRLPPSCPASCSAQRTDCDCLDGPGRCCDAAASTGVGCSDGSCPAAVNACGAELAGQCNPYCPGCFRRLSQTLRAVYGTANQWVVVGARGTVAYVDPADLFGVWTTPTCILLPPPLDESPLLASLHSSGSVFQAVGVAGGAFRFDFGGPCYAQSRVSPSTRFLNAVFATQDDRGYAVGDGGLLMSLNHRQFGTGEGGELDIVPTSIYESLYSLWVNQDDEGVEQIWLVGAGGRLMRASWY